MTTPAIRARAEEAQNRASDPRASAWVAASAGSGKTKLLTDRVLRLLLAGVPPGRILCLTFTKAAAAEMANRLARTLGSWVTAETAQLGTLLRRLTGETATEQTIATARTLFLRVLEQPGGMRISTIHAFAQSLLRAFPLEAGIPPHFAVLEEGEARLLLADEREAVLTAAPDPNALAHLAELMSHNGIDDLIAILAAQRSRLSPLLITQRGLEELAAALDRTLGLPAGITSEADLIKAACNPDDRSLSRAAALLKLSPNISDRQRGERMAAWLAGDVTARAAAWQEWRSLFLTKDNRQHARLVTDKVQDKAWVSATLAAEAERLSEVEEKRTALRLRAATCALLAIGEPVLRRYEAAKQRAGLLDYDDLIHRAERLLEDPGSAWVLYKLDGGIDHILLDEAQDSNPDQWRIVRALSAEFFAGEGAHEGVRTIFAVGDDKQSIYRFQGADPQGFARERAYYAAIVRGAGQEFREVALDVSFRSTAPILALVDAVFAAGPAREGVVAAEGQPLHHFADRTGEAGEVELWPLIAAAEAPDPPPWQPLETPATASGAPQRLATLLAARIRHMLEHDTLPSRVERGRESEQPRGRRIRPSDILILLRARGRGGFAAALVRNLKELGVPVGGMDRLVLAEQLAVQDLLALGEVLLLPEDDLSLAALLKSPLIGVSEEELFALAAPRQGSLWAALSAYRGAESRLGRVADWLVGLLNRVDRLTPHGLFAEVLGSAGPLDARPGRLRMLARLGPDAAEPLDEFLNAALAYERRHPPSLQGFIHAIRCGRAEVRRESEGAADAVRLMTVHGAKGLQAPIVILPDTTEEPRDRTALRWVADGLPLWAPRQEGYSAAALDARRRADQEEERRERHRLLYVALTRAEDRLIVCGWATRRGAISPDCWYKLIAAGFDRLSGTAGMDEVPFDPTAFGAPAGIVPAEAKVRRLSCPQTIAPRREEPRPLRITAAVLPPWVNRPPPPEAAEARLLPSALPGEEETPIAAPRPVDDPRGLRFRRGRLIHALLQHLPEQPPPRREAMARRFLGRPGWGLAPAEQEEILAEVMALLHHPLLAPAFAPESVAEAPLAGRIGTSALIGQVDRLVVTPERIIVLDYKTNRPPPPTAAAVPPLYLRQMAAYRALLRAAFPARPVICALVWTYGPQLMPLPDALLDAYAP